MNFGRIARALSPIIAIALAAGVSGCDGSTVSINGEEGKQLSELDLSGAAPKELVLLGPDEVRVIKGDKLAITLAGDPDAQAALRFTLKDGTLGVLRKDKLFGADKTAIVNVIMPPPEQVTMAGSGRIVLGEAAQKAEITMAGSGTIEASAISSDTLDVTVAGSGTVKARGSVRKLKLDMLGSGSAALDGLKVDKADVNIAGSGNTAFASDGEVDADILGSGEVKVSGRARCKVSAMGSGRLVCETDVVKDDDMDDWDEASGTPPSTPPAPPAPPKT